MKNITFRWIYTAGALLVLIGAFLKLQHWPNGNTIMLIGFVIGLFGYEFEVRRLRKKVKELEKKE